MIRYNLRCANDHSFDSWFQSAGAFDTLLQTQHLSCPVCASSQIEKALMTPAVRPGRSAAQGRPATSAQPALGGDQLPAARPSLQSPASEMELALAAMRRKIEENSEYVGMNFATEARAMHEGDAPERPIYGEAKVEDARKLIEDGVPVAPLPFIPPRKVN